MLNELKSIIISSFSAPFSKTVIVKSAPRASLFTNVIRGAQPARSRNDAGARLVSGKTISTPPSAVARKIRTHDTGAKILRAGNAQDAGGKIVVQPAFKMIFVGAIAVTGGAFVAAILIAICLDTKDPHIEMLFGLAVDTVKLGTGAIFGLLGGKYA
jgi:hypothetical protein